MVQYSGSALFNLAPDNTSYYSVTPPNVPAGDFAFVFIAKLPYIYTGSDPTVNASNVSSVGYITLAKNSTGDGLLSGGNNCWVRFGAANGSPTNAGKIIVNILKGGFSYSTSSFSNASASNNAVQSGDSVIVVVQRNAATNTAEVKMWNSRTNSVTTEYSNTANSSFANGSLGTWYLGSGSFSNVLQAFGMTSRAFSDSEIMQMSQGVDLDTIVPSGNRLGLWLFDNLNSSIPSTWGTAGAATKTGAWNDSGRVVGPIIPNQATNSIRVNEPRQFAFVSINDNGTAPTYTWTGTYTGNAPTSLQAKITNYSGSVVVDWVDLTSLSTSNGIWSGNMTIPAGSLYTIEVRDKITPSVAYKGTNLWSCGAVIVATGQSPHVIFQNDIKATVPLNGSMYVMINSTPQIFRIAPDGTGGVGRGLVQAANEFFTRAPGVPILSLNTAIVGTSSGDWSSKSSNTWPQFLSALDFVKPQRILISWLNGAAGSASLSTEKTNHQTLINNFQTDLTDARGIQWRYRMLPHNRDQSNMANNGNVRRSQYEIILDQNNPAKFIIGPWWADMMMDTEGSGTVQAAASTSVTLDPTDPTYGAVAKTIEILSGTGVGQTRSITSYNATTRVGTISSAWATIPDATSTYRTYGSYAHPNKTGIDNFAVRYGLDTAYNYGFGTVHGKGPQITSATYALGGNGAVIDVHVTHSQGTALQTPSGTTTNIPGFSVLSAASSGNQLALQTISSVVIKDSATLRITLAGSPINKSYLFVRYGDQVPVSSIDWNKIANYGLLDIVYDNSGIAPKGGLPLYFTLSDIQVSEELTPAQASQISQGFFNSY